MAKTIVGLFENMDDAQGAMTDLQSAGLSDNASFAPKAEPQLHTRLADAGIPKEDADLFADGVAQGYPMIVVQGVADEDAEETAAILDRRNVIDISRLSQNYQRRSLQRTTATAAETRANTNLYEGQDMVVPIIEEQVKIGKRMVEGGGIRIRKTIEEIPVSEQVTLREETVTLDRRPVDRLVDASDVDAFTEQSFEVRERDEEAVVSKDARVVEEVRVKKDAAERTETITDTVRRTKVDVEQIAGETRAVSGTTTTSTSTAQDEGMIEGGLSRAGNAVERATGLDLDRDSDVGQRDPRNNV